jgi:predicted esterase
MCARRWLVAFALALPLVAARADDADDVADVPSQDLRAGGDAQKRYFLVGPAKDSKAPAAGRGLVVILPGGDGSADFHPFVKRIFKHALPDGYVAAQPVALKWTDDQQVVWPTAGLKALTKEAKFTTEEFIAAVVDDVGKKHALDRKRVFVLGWSSSGPAAYTAILQEKPAVAGAFVAMSVFKPDTLPPLARAKGRPVYLYHSPDDRVCPFYMAKRAEKDLGAAGAAVKLTEYDGGHGWRGGLYDEIRGGVEWLEKQAPKP